MTNTLFTSIPHRIMKTYNSKKTRPCFHHSELRPCVGGDGPVRGNATPETVDHGDERIVGWILDHLEPPLHKASARFMTWSAVKQSGPISFSESCKGIMSGVMSSRSIT
jgi:hypothetical protein